MSVLGVRIGTVGRYTGSIADDVIKAAADNYPEITDKVMTDAISLTPEAMIALAPKKKHGGFMMNRKSIVFSYPDTLEDPGYHENVRLIMVLRAVPIDPFSIMLSFDKVSTHDF